MVQPRTPTAIKHLTRTTRPDRANLLEPTPAKGKPKAPAHLSKKAKTAFERFADLLDSIGVLTRMIRANPAASLLADADRRLRNYLNDFGMSAASRAKVSVADMDKQQGLRNLLPSLAYNPEEDALRAASIPGNVKA
jgi:phage terminase small subunit